MPREPVNATLGSSPLEGQHHAEAKTELTRFLEDEQVNAARGRCDERLHAFLGEGREPVPEPAAHCLDALGRKPPHGRLRRIDATTRNGKDTQAHSRPPTRSDSSTSRR